MKPLILLVDDEPSIIFGYTKYFSKAGYETVSASSLAEAREIILTKRFDGIILDLNLPDGNGIEWITDLREEYQEIAIVVITGVGDIPTAVEAIRLGADNFITKPVDMNELDVFLRKSLELTALRRGKKVQQRMQKKSQIYFGESSAMKKVKEFADLMAGNDSPLILQGETGTGKGVLAQWIHDNSLRRDMPLIEVNCSSFHGELLASELFGHVKGAFTSAVQNRQGLVEVADGGTLFLDEIGDMDLRVQTQFLKVIEEKSYRRLGETSIRKSDFRIICATNRDLKRETEEGRFRKDLYFRISLFPIDIPPLRERPEDLPGLVRYLLRNLGHPNLQIPSHILDRLMAYDWPGNIRELRNVIERSVLISRGGPLDVEHFSGLEPCSGLKKSGSLKELEENYINELVSELGSDMNKVAEAMGISRATLYRKLKKFRESK